VWHYPDCVDVAIIHCMLLKRPTSTEKIINVLTFRATSLYGYDFEARHIDRQRFWVLSIILNIYDKDTILGVESAPPSSE